MKSHAHWNSLEIEVAASQFGNRIGKPEKTMRGNAANTENIIWLQYRYLGSQIAYAGIAFRRRRFAIIRWSAFYYVSYIAVAVSRKIYCHKHLVEKLTRSPYKGQALPVFFYSRSFTYNHYAWV